MFSSSLSLCLLMFLKATYERLFWDGQSLVQKQKTIVEKGWGATFQRTLVNNFYTELFIFLGVQAFCCYFSHQTSFWWMFRRSGFDLKSESGVQKQPLQHNKANQSCRSPVQNYNGDKIRCLQCLNDMTYKLHRLPVLFLDSLSLPYFWKYSSLVHYISVYMRNDNRSPALWNLPLIPCWEYSCLTHQCTWFDCSNLFDCAKYACLCEVWGRWCVSSCPWMVNNLIIYVRLPYLSNITFQSYELICFDTC